MGGCSPGGRVSPLRCDRKIYPHSVFLVQNGQNVAGLTWSGRASKQRWARIERADWVAFSWGCGVGLPEYQVSLGRDLSWALVQVFSQADFRRECCPLARGLKQGKEHPAAARGSVLARALGTGATAVLLRPRVIAPIPRQTHGAKGGGSKQAPRARGEVLKVFAMSLSSTQKTALSEAFACLQLFLVIRSGSDDNGQAQRW